MLPTLRPFLFSQRTLAQCPLPDTFCAFSYSSTTTLGLFEVPVFSLLCCSGSTTTRYLLQLKSMTLKTMLLAQLEVSFLSSRLSQMTGCVSLGKRLLSIIVSNSL